MGNRSNYCTLLFTIKLTNTPPASCLLACDCCTVHKATDSLLSMLFRSDLIFKSRITRIYCAPPATAGAGAGAGPPPSLSDPEYRRLTLHLRLATKPCHPMRVLVVPFLQLRQRLLAEVVHHCKELVEVGRLVIVSVVWRLARVVVQGRFVKARKFSTFGAYLPT